MSLEKDLLKEEELSLQFIKTEISLIQNIGIKKELSDILSDRLEGGMFSLSWKQIETIEKRLNSIFKNLEDIIEVHGKSIKETLELIPDDLIRIEKIKLANDLIVKVAVKGTIEIAIGSIQQMEDDVSEEESAVIMLADLLKKKKLREISRLVDRKDKEYILQEVEGYISGIIDAKYQKMKKKMFANKKMQNELIEELQTTFNIGKSNFQKIKSQRTQDEIANFFEKQGLPGLKKEILRIIEEKIDKFGDVGDVIQTIVNILDSVFKDNAKTLEEACKHFAGAYMSPEFEAIAARKVGSSKPKEKKDRARKEEVTTSKKEKGTIEYDPKKIAFLDTLFATHSKKEEIKEYILKLSRKGKNILIHDLAQEFGINPATFTANMICEAGKVGICFVKNNDKTSIDKTEKNKEVPKEPEIKVNHIKEKTKEEKLLETIAAEIDSNKVFEAEQCINALEMGGYTIPNKKSFTTSFNILYPTTEAKKGLAEELKVGILITPEGLNQKRKKKYRTIDLKKLNRILFFEKNIIDGIYNHTDYMKRLNNQK
ncbi:MAG: hypothetical protein NTX91_03985 [candidate division SR1 bacterium]|nr:hypothetical protein [candidate division SR1 bacterium]